MSDEEYEDDEYEDDDEDELAPADRRLDPRSALPRDVLGYVARAIVDDLESIRIDNDQRGSRLTLRLQVAPDDMGRVIGRRGRVAQAIRAVVRAAGAREGLDTEVDIVD